MKFLCVNNIGGENRFTVGAIYDGVKDIFNSCLFELKESGLKYNFDYFEQLKKHNLEEIKDMPIGTEFIIIDKDNIFPYKKLIIDESKDLLWLDDNGEKHKIIYNYNFSNSKFMLIGKNISFSDAMINLKNGEKIFSIDKNGTKRMYENSDELKNNLGEAITIDEINNGAWYTIEKEVQI